MAHKRLHSSIALPVYIHHCYPMHHERYSVYIELEHQGLLCRGPDSVFEIPRSQRSREGVDTAAPYPEECDGGVLTQCGGTPKLRTFRASEASRTTIPINSVSPSLSISGFSCSSVRAVVSSTGYMLKEHK